jgi:hypothetical protein
MARSEDDWAMGFWDFTKNEAWTQFGWAIERII